MRVLRPSDRRRLKAAYFGVLGAAQVERILRQWRSRPDVALVLNFHRISPQHNPYWPPMPPEVFEQLVDHLANRCQVRTLAELDSQNSVSAPRVVLSFDDGCRDFVEYAIPILDRRGLRANQNVIVESVETGRPPWIIAVVDALNAASAERVRALAIPGFGASLADTDDAAKARFGTQLTSYLKALAPADRQAVSTDLEALIEETDPARLTPMMSRSDVQEIAEQHELGAHSYSHEAMAQLSDEEFESDLDKCGAFFDGLGRPLRIYAFPYGSYRAGQIESVRARGVEHVLLVGERPAVPGSGVYPRITMYGESQAELRLRAMGYIPSRV